MFFSLASFTITYVTELVTLTKAVKNPFSVRAGFVQELAFGEGDLMLYVCSLAT